MASVDLLPHIKKYSNEYCYGRAVNIYSAPHLTSGCSDSIARHGVTKTNRYSPGRFRYSARSMPYVPGFINDIFISFSHVDNLGGWVEMFQDALRTRLLQIGAEVSIWRDS